MLPAPHARRDDLVEVVHGTPIADPYRWLEFGDTPDVQRWVAAQNERTRQALDARPDRGTWHERLVALMQLPVIAGMQVRGSRLFAWERPAGAEQFGLALASADDPRAPSRTLLDPATWAADAAAAIDWFEASHDGSLVAFGRSEGGTEDSELRVLDVLSGELLDDRIPHARAASIAWLPDGSGFRYTRYPEDSEYDRKVYFHRLGDDPADDQLVWDALPTPETWPDVVASRDGRHVLVHAMVGWGHVEVHLLDVVAGTWQTLIEGVEAVSEFRFGGDGLVGTTTLDAPRGRIVTVGRDDPAAEHWRTVVAEGDAVRGLFVVRGDEVVSVATERAIDRIERHALADGSFRGTIDALGAIAVVALDADDRSGTGTAPPDGPAVDTNGTPLFIAATGFTSPTALWRWTEHEGLRPWGADPAAGAPELTVRQERYRSLDGTEIGIFLIHAADVALGPETPAILNGYGGFAIAETPNWSPQIAAWCEAGGLFAIAGLRGGYEEGERWHHAGRREYKQNVFDDFHAAGDWLVAEGLTSRDRLGIFGGSNGGLLVGAALTQRPESHRAVWCAVPLLDMIRYPRFLIARLWTDEYGDPDIAEEFAWLAAYSPYHHVVEGTRYPAVLLTTAEGDTRVDPLHARKMAALLQHAGAGQDERPILLHQEGRAGHGVGKPVSKRADEQADALAFFAWQLGMPNRP
ncbi:MAG: prolyl oligopeptidase family protein [Acidimicrobiia bacterium]